MANISKLITHNTISGLRRAKLKYRHFSSTPFFANKEMKKSMRHTKEHLCAPY